MQTRPNSSDMLTQLNKTRFESFTPFDRPAELWGGQAIANLLSKYPNALDFTWSSLFTPNKQLAGTPDFLLFETMDRKGRKEFFVASTEIKSYAFNITQVEFERHLDLHWYNPHRLEVVRFISKINDEQALVERVEIWTPVYAPSIFVMREMPKFADLPEPIRVQWQDDFMTYNPLEIISSNELRKWVMR